jgi:hypothetical protein
VLDIQGYDLIVGIDMCRALTQPEERCHLGIQGKLQTSILWLQLKKELIVEKTRTVPVSS